MPARNPPPDRFPNFESAFSIVLRGAGSNPDEAAEHDWRLRSGVRREVLPQMMRRAKSVVDLNLPARESAAEFGRRHFLTLQGTTFPNGAAMHVRAFKLVMAMLLNEYDGLTEDDIALANKVAPLLTRLPSNPPEHANPEPEPRKTKVTDRIALVDVAFSWVRRAKINGHPALALASTQAAVAALDPAEAPVQFLLPTPRDAGHMEIRKHGSLWLRPVLTPDRWAPVSLDEFAAACASGRAWRDRPYAALDSPDDRRPDDRIIRPAFSYTPHIAARAGLHDVAFEAKPRNAAEREAIKAREDSIAAAFSSLFVIDGKVWTAGPKPRLCLVSVPRTGKEWIYALTWRMGDLNGIEPQNTLWHLTECGEAVEWRDRRDWPLCMSAHLSGPNLIWSNSRPLDPVLLPDGAPFPFKIEDDALQAVLDLTRSTVMSLLHHLAYRIQDYGYHIEKDRFNAFLTDLENAWIAHSREGAEAALTGIRSVIDRTDTTLETLRTKYPKEPPDRNRRDAVAAYCAFEVASETTNLLIDAPEDTDAMSSAFSP